MKRNRVPSIVITLALLVVATAAAQQANTTITPSTSDVTTSGGTKNTVPIFTTSKNIQNSILTQSGTEINVGGTLSATGPVNGSSFEIGGLPFAFGSDSNYNAFLGFAGNSSITGQGNSGVGAQALLSDTTGYWNTAIGFQALADDTTGAENTAIGTDALAHDTSGYGNTATGYYALVNNTIGVANIATGGLALQSNVIGSANVADGYQALASTTSGGNTAVGHMALYNNTIGQLNTSIGGISGVASDGSAITGSNNTFLGAGADPSTGTLTNATAIGTLALVSQSNSVVLGSINGVNQATADTYVGIGTTAPTNIFTIGQGHGQALADGWATYSSRRWKTNIQTLPDALEKVEKLRGVSYDLKDSGKHEVGVIAEEVGAVVPEVVTFEANGKDARGVDYSRLTALLIEAVKEQQKEIAAQTAQLHQQTAQITALRSQVKQGAAEEAVLERRLAQIERVGERANQLAATYRTGGNGGGR
jgi:trimeric autotransporter adhesin